MDSPTDSIQQTFTGKLFNPFDLRPEDVDVRDIAHALSMQCRFTGHTSRFYSVAEHSLHVYEAVRVLRAQPSSLELRKPTDGLYALLHDASEAYLCDVPRPLKLRPEFAFYRDAERRTMRIIYEAFNLDPSEEPRFVKRADEILRGIEARDLMGAKPSDACWVEALELIPAGLTCRESLATLAPGDVKARFLARVDREISHIASRVPDHDPELAIAAGA